MLRAPRIPHCFAQHLPYFIGWVNGNHIDVKNSALDSLYGAELRCAFEDLPDKLGIETIGGGIILLFEPPHPRDWAKYSFLLARLLLLIRRTY